MSEIIFAIVMHQLCTMATTIYWHRGLCHKSVTYHPAIEEFFRFILWVTGGLTNYRTAQHIKHHKTSDTVKDPHSPVVKGFFTIAIVFPALASLQYIFFLPKPKESEDFLKEYNVTDKEDYVTKYPRLGRFVFLVTSVLLFGFINGLILFVCFQLLLNFSLYFIAVAMVHYVGYQNFKTGDSSRNIVPIGVVCYGDELHNNHHANPRSAKLSAKPWEFDLGWGIIWILSKLGLARVNFKAYK